MSYPLDFDDILKEVVAEKLGKTYTPPIYEKIPSIRSEFPEVNPKEKEALEEARKKWQGEKVNVEGLEVEFVKKPSTEGFIRFDNLICPQCNYHSPQITRTTTEVEGVEWLSGD